jgi:hypothetical protein
VLWWLTALFFIRVVAQPAALLFDHPFLPRFESWYSGAVPYPWLLVSQILILVLMLVVSSRASAGALERRPTLGRVLTVLGGVYFGAMMVRLVLGATVLSSSRWFASPVPTVFHLVLASFLVVWGRHHSGRLAADKDSVSTSLGGGVL